MANILIVHAHPEPKSFSSALANKAAASLSVRGHAVTFSNLYELGFDPVSSRKNYTTVSDPAYLKPQIEELNATRNDGFAPELEREMRKLEACDVLIFSFPMWWFGMPAILKGWVDRVFAMGRVYGGGKLYENGIGQGKRAMVITTTGSPATAFRQNGVHASLDSILAPIHRGIFWFNGYAPLQPFVTWRAAHITHEARVAELERLDSRMSRLLEEPRPTLLKLADCEQESWGDTMPRFLVVVDGSEHLSSDEANNPANLEQLRQLRLEGKLIRVHLPMPPAGAWQAALQLRAPDAAHAESYARSIGFAEKATLSCTMLDPAAEDRILAPDT